MDDLGVGPSDVSSLHPLIPAGVPLSSELFIKFPLGLLFILEKGSLNYAKSDVNEKDYLERVQLPMLSEDWLPWRLLGMRHMLQFNDWNGRRGGLAELLSQNITRT